MQGYTGIFSTGKNCRFFPKKLRFFMLKISARFYKTQFFSKTSANLGLI
jgi:hypothetical protein